MSDDATLSSQGSEKFSAPPAKPRKQRSSRFALDYGTRSMKAYPMTEGELNGLAALGLGATVAFALASFLFGLAMDLQKDLSLAPDTPPEAAAFWGAVRLMSFIAAFIAAGIGVFLVLRGNTKLNRIKQDTSFDA